MPQADQAAWRAVALSLAASASCDRSSQSSMARCRKTMAEGAEDVAVMRVVVREGFSRDLADEMLNKLRDAVTFFEKNPPTPRPPETTAFAH